MQGDDLRFHFTVSDLSEGEALTFDEMEQRFIAQAGADDRTERRKALWNLAIIYSKSERHEEAIQRVEQLLKENDDVEERASCYLALGQLMEGLQDYAAARDYYKKAVLHEPCDKQTWYLIHNNLGYCLNQLGEHDDAVPLLRWALEIDPNRPNAYKNLGMAYEALAQRHEAANMYVAATQVQALDGRSLKLLEAMVETHPELLVDLPDLQKQIESCRDAVRIAAEHQPDFRAHWDSLRQEQQRSTKKRWWEFWK